MIEPFTPAFFRQLQQLKIHTRRAFLGSRQGGHLSLRRGHGLEFADFRQYAPGDDFRHIDWGVYGRTDRLYVRQFREEQDLNVMLLIDTSRSMAFPEQEGKFELARDVALALGYVGLADGDTVTFALLGQTITPRYSGPKAISRAWNAVRQVTPGGTFSLVNEVRAAAARLKIPGKCFFLSDFYYPLEEISEALDFLRSRNFDLSVLHVLGKSELSLEAEGGAEQRGALFEDSETGELLELAIDRSSNFEYAKALASHIEGVEQYCRNAALAHVLISSRESVADVVLTRLPDLGLLK